MLNAKHLFAAVSAAALLSATVASAGEMCHHAGMCAGKDGMHMEKSLTKQQKRNPAIAAYVAASKKMHKAMMINYTGDPDVDFVAGMIPHHQGAVDMAEVELKYGKDEKLKALAQSIITGQTEEIAMMSSWLRGRQGFKYPDAELRPTTKGFVEAMHKMHAHMNISYTGDPDVDFARGMIPHHQGAIDMADVYKPYGKYQQFEDLATNIISSQSQEIRVMQEWLEAHPTPAGMKYHQKKHKNNDHSHH